MPRARVIKQTGTANLRIIAAVGLAIIALVVGGYFVLGRSRAEAPVKVIFRLSVTPGEQMEFVVQQANSARFKYEIGKASGVKPFLAQRLSLKPVPNSSLLEGQIGAQTREEAHRYIEVFLDTLQAQCGTQAQLALAEQSIR